MNKLILISLLIGLASPALAQGYYPRYSGPGSEASHVNPVAPYNYQPTCTYNGYQPCNSPDVNPPITRSEYPGALDPVRNLPEWSYNP
jgi:hypothetical protein